jgi:hypothetical protein
MNNKLASVIGLAIGMTSAAGCGSNNFGTSTALDVGAVPLTSMGSAVVDASAPKVGACQVFPSNNPWNTDISQAPVDPNSANYLAHMNAPTKHLHPDFGSDPTYGIPYITVPGSQRRVPMSFTNASESDPGPYPFPPNAPIEGGNNSTGDRHVIVIDIGHCVLYETFSSYYVNPGWQAYSGADYWTSADAAGLPIFAGLTRYYEVQAGAINHALRFTVARTQRAFVHPATHYASSSVDRNDPPMGLRVRLKASYDLSPFSGESLVVLKALKKYGMFVADNGADWFISGETNTKWNDGDLDQLKTVPASAFEVVKLGPIIH